MLIALNFVTAIFWDLATSLYYIFFGDDFIILTKDKQAALSLMKDKVSGAINDSYSFIAIPYHALLLLFYF